MEILRLKQACFRIKIPGICIYTDPFQIPETDEHRSKADIILISHSHFDHCHLPSIKHISNEHSLIIVPESGKKVHHLFPNTVPLKPGEFFNQEGIEITAFPAYNIDKFFHRKKKNWVGYLVKYGSNIIYHAGDTDVIPEMENLTKLNINFAFIPIGGKFVMDINEAVKAVGIIQPQNVIPMHEIKSSINDFEKLVKVNLKNPDINIIKLKNGDTFCI